MEAKIHVWVCVPVDRHEEAFGEMFLLLLALWLLLLLPMIGLFVAEGRRTDRERADRPRLG